ncbi:hypothetical protein AB6A40_000633 [Gnathostoma spinigerum]|uniref:Uncharacterized protein n=1 Tax=Gnathostoma spinigerum TaxID=75299 RepID=A0ABD6E986_9BILA
MPKSKILIAKAMHIEVPIYCGPTLLALADSILSRIIVDIPPGHNNDTRVFLHDGAIRCPLELWFSFFSLLHFSLTLWEKLSKVGFQWFFRERVAPNLLCSILYPISQNIW